MAFFSIIIPLYNKENFIENTIKSVLNQTFQSFEVIVVNDAVGRTPVILAEIVGKILLLQNPKKSVGAARNFGVSNSRGKFIIFLDDDFLISKVNKLHMHFTKIIINDNRSYLE